MNNTLPQFSKIDINNIAKQVEDTFEKNRAKIKELLNSNEYPTWKNFVSVFEQINDEEHRLVQPFMHLNSVQDSQEIRDQYDIMRPLLTAENSWRSQNKKIYDKYLQLRNGDEFSSLSSEQQNYIDHTIKEFKLSGIDLDQDIKDQLTQLSDELSELSNKFEKNVLDSNKDFIHISDVSRLAGVSENNIESFRQNAIDEGLDGWVIRLSYANYIPVMCYAHDRSLREALYMKKSSVASTYSANPSFDNSPIMKQMLEKRQEAAKLLGFNTFADLTLQTRMAKTTDEVMDFLTTLKDRCYVYARQDFDDLEMFVHNHYPDADDLEIWDMSYYVTRMEEKCYNLDNEKIKEYFPLDHVIDGLFKVINTLYGVEFKRNTEVDVYNEHVRYYDVLQDGQIIAGFYFDLYSRKNKNEGAWMDVAVNRYDNNGEIQLPVAYMVCNFMMPADGKPSLITHDDVITLFHEFGHGLHLMLTKVNTFSSSGINGVEWDAVELPSQIMENWCWNKEALKMLTSHYETGESIPDELYQSMIDAKNFRSGTKINRYAKMALFDFILHMRTTYTDNTIQELINELNKEMYFGPKTAFDVFGNSFTHIFSGGYAAGYYSYGWAEVLSADAFSKFEEDGIFNSETGAKFRNEVLSKGSSRPAIESFKAFRGREPNSDAYFRHNGLKGNS